MTTAAGKRVQYKLRSAKVTGVLREKEWAGGEKLACQEVSVRAMEDYQLWVKVYRSM